MIVDVIVKVIRPTLIYVRTVPYRLYIKAYAGIKVTIWYIFLSTCHSLFTENKMKISFHNVHTSGSLFFVRNSET